MNSKYQDDFFGILSDDSDCDIDEESSPNKLVKYTNSNLSKKNNLLHDKGFVKDTSSFKYELLEIFEKKTNKEKKNTLADMINPRPKKYSLSKNFKSAVHKRFSKLQVPSVIPHLSNKGGEGSSPCEYLRKGFRNGDNREFTRKISSSKILELMK